MKSNTRRRTVKSNKYTLDFRKTIVDIYHLFPDKDKIDAKTFRSVLISFNYILMKSMIDTGATYQLPKGLGLLYIARQKVENQTKQAIDFNYLQKTGIKKYHKNKHSQGYTASFKWYKFKPYFNLKVPARAYYRPVRGFKRYLAKCIKEHNTIDKYTIYD